MSLKPLKERNLTRLLLGPGPTNPYKEVLEAQAYPLLGHLDPTFSDIMDDLSAAMRTLFQTNNKVCFAGSGTGSAGMELLAMNLVEEGDTVIVGVNGVFGGRIAEMCEKLKAKVVPIKVPYGEGISLKMVEDAISSCNNKVDIVWLVMAETSTGYLHTNLREVSELTHKAGGLFLLDCVTGLGGVELKIDDWGIDAAFSGTQKCLGVPPCLSPITMNEKAISRIQSRKTPIPSWYFDVSKLLGYWQKKEGKRSYHHTAPISSLYGLYEGVRLILDEGLHNVQKRHKEAGEALKKELESRGFVYAVKEVGNRLPNLHCVYPPEDVDEAKLRKNLLEKGVEIGAGLGSFAGKAVRVGVMGANATVETVQKFVKMLDEVLPHSKK